MLKSRFIAFLKDEEGASAIEYALVAAMVAVGLVTFIPTIRAAIVAIFTSIQTALTSAAGS
ncbi:Flp family type IVb pilin [Dechloromonas sp. A34]|uniref:Flp family type IVb pilin n=1 Tax=Dechloromonas sp. A34 TaxID=447588 RepID=UPI0022492FFF|nr:Flp family type IVb pilin [Dechloromonas sp. A34]